MASLFDDLPDAAVGLFDDLPDLAGSQSRLLTTPVYAGQEVPKAVAPVTPPSTVPPTIDLNVEAAQRARETPLDFREMAEKTKEHLLTGPEAIKPFTVDRDEHWTKAVLKEAANLPIGLANFFLTPLGTITPFVAPAAPGLVAGGFALDTLAGVASQVGDLLGSWDRLSPAEQAAALTRITGSSALAGLLAKGGKEYLGKALNNARKTIISETGRDIFLGSPAQRAADMLESAAERMPSQLLSLEQGEMGPTPIVQPVTPMPMARPPGMVTMPEFARAEIPKPAAPAAIPKEEYAAQERPLAESREPERPGTPPGTAIPADQTQVREGEGQRPSGGNRPEGGGNVPPGVETRPPEGEVLLTAKEVTPSETKAPRKEEVPVTPTPAETKAPGEVKPAASEPAAVEKTVTPAEVEEILTTEIEFEFPKADTAEARKLIDAEDAVSKLEDSLIEKRDQLETEAKNAKPGSKKRDVLETRAQKAREDVWNKQKENAELHESRRFMYLEHLVQTGDPAQRIAAASKLLSRRAERMQKRADELIESGDRNSAYKLYDEARNLGKKAAELSNQGYLELTPQVQKTLVNLGATPKEALFEAQQIVNMQMSYPGMKSVSETPLRMRAIENDRIKASIEKQANDLLDEYKAGSRDRNELWQKLKIALPDEKRVQEILKEYRNQFEQQKKEELKQQEKVQQKAREDELAMLDTARELEAKGKLQWTRYGAAGASFWRPVEGKPVKIKNAPNHNFFIWKSGVGNWSVVESSTGLSVGHGKTQGDAIIVANDRIAKAKDFEKLVELGMRNSPPKPEISKITKPEPLKSEAAPSMGPGAQTVGEPGKAQIEQLTDAMRGVQGRKLTLGEKVKDAFAIGEAASKTKDAVSRALSGLKSAGDYLYQKWAGFDTVDEMLRAKGDLSADLEKRGWRVREFVKQVQKAMPDKRQRAAIAKWVDAGGDATDLQRGLAETKPQYRQAYQDALNLSGDALVTAQNIRNYFDARLQEAIDAGVLEHGIEDYIHRIYEKDPKARDAALAHVQSGILAKNPALAKKRIFQFDWEAEKLGYRPVQDFLPRIAQYESSLSKAIAAREFIKKATTMKAPDGRPVIGVKGMGFPVENAEGVREATLIRPSINPKAEVGTPEYRGDYVNREYPALSKWKWVASDTAGNPILLQGDVAIHPAFVSRVDALLEPSKVRYGKYGKVLRPAMQVGSTVKQTMLDMSFFHQVQIAVHAAEHRVMPWKLIKELDFENPNIDGLLRGGITLGGEYYTGHYGEGLVGRSLTRAIPGLGQLMESYHNWLFQNFIPRVKMTMGLDALERNRSRYAKELASGKMTERDLFHLTAQQANAAFGELNYTMLERNKTTQDLARLILLAPDFLEARGRFAGQAFTKYGSEQRMALFLGAVTMYTLARIANKVLDDQYHFEPENLFSVIYNGRSYGLRTVQGDILHFLKQPLQFWMSRLNPVYGRTMLELATGRDYFGRKRTFTEQMGDAISTMVPIALRTGRERKLWESVINAFGVTARRWNDVDSVYKLAQDWKAKNGIQERGEFIYDSEKDPLRPLKIALSFNDEAEAVLELKKLLDSGKSNLRQLTQYFDRYATMPFTGSRVNDAKFRLTLNEDERKTYEAAVEHRLSITRLFRKARSQLNTPSPMPTPPPTPPANPFSALPNAAE